MTTYDAVSHLPVAISQPEPSVAEGIVSLAGLERLDAAVLARLVRAHGRLARRGVAIQVVNASPSVGREMSQLGLAWMLSEIPAANEPMRRAA